MLPFATPSVPQAQSWPQYIWSPLQIQEMLNEADWDDDKLVTLEDFKNVLDTN